MTKYNNMATFAALGLAGTLLAGCATPMAPTLTQADADNFGTTVDTLATNSATASMPTTGSASYAGLLGAALDGEPGAILGDIGVDVDFASANITGAVTGMNVIGIDGVDDQTLSGSIDLSGSFTGNAMTATGANQLGMVVDSFNVGLDLDMTLTGTFRDDASTADTITGTVAADGTINLPFGGGQEDFSVTGAEFYLQEQ